MNNWRITHPRATSSLSASRLPWCAAQSVGVIPSSSGAFRSLRVASFSKCRWPSRAARWYLSFMAAKDGYMSMAAATDPSIPAHGRSFGVCCVGEVSRALLASPLEGLQARSRGCYGRSPEWPRPLPISAHLTDETRWHIQVKSHSITSTLPQWYILMQGMM